MRARLLAALVTAAALTTAGAVSAQASSSIPPDASSTSVETSTTVASTSPPSTTATTTATTVPGDDEVLPDTIPPVAIDDAGSAAGAATRTGTTIQVGDTPPPPEFIVPENSGTGRRVVYSNSAMRVWAVEEDGTVVKTHRVSGKVGQPSPGEYTVWSRSLYTYSATNPSIRWQYMVRFAWTPRGGNIGFHEIPRDCGRPGCPLMQTEDQLGEALSGGCVRQAQDDAIWMWEWAQLGTKVVVLP